MKHQKTSKIISKTLLGLAIFGIFGGYYIFTPSPADATDIDVSATVDAVASLVLDKHALSFNITPDSNGVFAFSSFTASVSTNNPQGYKLFLTSNSNTTSLNGVANTSSANKTIGTSNFSKTSFSGSSTWGVHGLAGEVSVNQSMAEGYSYTAVPAKQTSNAALINQNATSITNDKSTVVVGAIAKDTTTAGHYTGELLLSVVFEPQSGYLLSVSQGTGSTISISRLYSQVGGAKLGALVNGDTIYEGDTLRIVNSPLDSCYQPAQLSVTGYSKFADGVYTVGKGGVSVSTSNSSKYTYSIIYLANGGTGSLTDTKTCGQNYTIRSNTSVGISRSNYTFTGYWNVAANGSGQAFVTGATYNVDAPLTIYAQWRENGASGNNAPARSPSAPQNNDNGQNAEDTNPGAQGEKVVKEGTVTTVTGMSANTLKSIGVGVVFISSVTFFIIVAFKRDDDDDDEEEKGTTA